MGLSEFELIARHFTRETRRTDVPLGVGDDAALLRVQDDHELVAAIDTLVEGRHFLPGIEPRSIGHQALAVNLSDLAAMGAEPAWALLALSIPEADDDWLREFAAGFHALAEMHGVALAGGDTVRGPRVITVTALGQVRVGTALRRSGARAGDAIFVSGAPGEAAAGLELLKSGARARSPLLVQRLLYAEPRVELGRRLRGLASAAMDVSDGLLDDLGRLCEASGAGADVDLERLPLSTEVLRLFERSVAERMLLHGGDDYELLFTVPAHRADAARSGLETTCTVTRIGTITEGRAVRCLRGGKPVSIEGHGHDHFR